MILSRLRTRIEKNLLIILTVQVNVKRIMVKKQKKKKNRIIYYREYRVVNPE